MVWLAQIVAVIPPVLGDHWWTRIGLMFNCTLCDPHPRAREALYWIYLPHNATRPDTANASDDFARGTHRCSISRSSSVNTNSATSPPLREIW